MKRLFLLLFLFAALAAAAHLAAKPVDEYTVAPSLNDTDEMYLYQLGAPHDFKLTLGQMKAYTLAGLPTIPAAQVNSDWNATSGLAQVLNKPTLDASGGLVSFDYATTTFAPLASPIFTGTVTADGFVGNGSTLTGLTPAQVGAAPAYSGSSSQLLLGDGTVASIGSGLNLFGGTLTSSGATIGSNASAYLSILSGALSFTHNVNTALGLVAIRSDGSTPYPGTSYPLTTLISGKAALYYPRTSSGFSAILASSPSEGSTLFYGDGVTPLARNDGGQPTLYYGDGLTPLSVGGGGIFWLSYPDGNELIDLSGNLCSNLPSGSILVSGGPSNPITPAAPSDLQAIVGIFAGTIFVAGGGGTDFFVSIGHTMPNTNYTVGISPRNALSDASRYISAKTTTSFTVTYTTGRTGNLLFDWSVTPQ